MDFDNFNHRDTQFYPSAQVSLLSLYEADFSLRKPEVYRVADAGINLGDVMRDPLGNFTEYLIGPADRESEVVVNYDDPAANPAVVGRTEITRPDGRKIVFERQRDSADANSNFVYAEKRDGVQSDLLYGNMDVATDGRINVYFDFERKRKAMSFNPTTGGEEY